jgi:hypothetical protein
MILGAFEFAPTVSCKTKIFVSSVNLFFKTLLAPSFGSSAYTNEKNGINLEAQRPLPAPKPAATEVFGSN